MEQSPSLFFSFWILGKPRITFLVTLSCFIGFYMAPCPFDSTRALWSCVATWLVAFGASALNQFMEYDVDAKMNRTQMRPIPSGNISGWSALALGLVVTIAGLVLFIWKLNLLAAGFALLTSLSYLLLYTPMKRLSSLCTIVGAVPGALPPVIGWVSAVNAVSGEALILFAILFLWQLPHFLAIAWIYSQDYGQAKLPMLTVVDPTGVSVGQQLLLYASALLPVALLPSMVGMTGVFYFYAAFILGLIYLGFSWALKKHKNILYAKRLLLVSVMYLPLLFLVMALDKYDRL